ncbi:MAG TPA: UPF0175 family protein, partial [Candidatus Acidoferrales bacterium]|nr:UPF0175 family protein [Candidatus Acidoferrales bacterium]
MQTVVNEFLMRMTILPWDSEAAQQYGQLRATGCARRQEPITVELPDDIAGQIQKRSGDIGPRMLEAFASEGYRSGNLTGWQIRQLLDLKNRFEVDSFLKRAGQFYRSLRSCEKFCSCNNKVLFILEYLLHTRGMDAPCQPALIEIPEQPPRKQA